MPGTVGQTLDRFFSAYLECDLTRVTPGRVLIIPSNRREIPELHYENPFALWLVATGNRCIISVQPALETPLKKLIARMPLPIFHLPEGRRMILETVARALNLPGRVSAFSGPILFATRGTFRPVELHPCRQITTADIPVLQTAGLYDTCLDRSIAEGTCYAAFDGPDPVSLAGTREVPHLQDRIAEMYVPGTIPAKRREGYGKTCLSSATRAVIQSGRIPLYLTSDLNPGSIATARAVGYQPYGRQFRVEIATAEPPPSTTPLPQSPIF
ncbi:MAG: hypothetical protein N2248_07345 [candidate division WOR-3 bacterium]|uniref:Uncharacterized protein n=1 Tax=candidate division WOR-3 bacterium TaxID=2052148 RepID=A0A7C3ES53_UNCW3|nr:hypothetical protein [candidate division WOR-3 bacterium]